MFRLFKKVFNIIMDREIDFDRRMYNLVMLSGVFSALGGMIVCILAHVPLVGILLATAICLGAFILLMIGMQFPSLIVACKYVLMLGISFLIPGIWLTSGGLKSGVNLWFVYGLIFAGLLFTGSEVILASVIFIFCALSAYVISIFFPDFVWVFSNERDIYISTIGSALVVGIALLITLAYYKKIYIEEQKISRNQQQELEEVNEVQKSFFANISHEIRTPINTIIGLNEMNLRDDNLSEDIQENCENIQAASRMLLSLINDVLDISKIQSKKMDIVPEKYEISSMLSELVNMIWIRAHDKGLEFRLDVAEDIPTVFYGDAVRIKQILINILTNAVKYTEKGYVELSIKGEQVDHRHYMLNMIVSDSGIGIKKEDIKYLFDSFKRVDQQRTKAIEGTGLGLSITNSLVELMGGNIKVDSIYQRGTTFTVSLEQEIIDATPVGAIGKSMKNRGKKNQRQKYIPSIIAPDAKVLVVDDNKLNQIVATKLLKDTQVKIDVASSGKQCLEMTMNKHYDIIFMDHLMPEMDGIETLNNIRNEEMNVCVNVPVVALTANAGNGLEDYYLQEGFQSYLVKPISGASLEATLKKLLPIELIHRNEAYEEEMLEEADDIDISYSRTFRKKLIITTDSVSDLPQELMDKYNIRCNPYLVESEDGRFREGIEIWPENIFDLMEKKGGKIKSSPPEIEEYEQFFGKVLGEAEQIIHVCMTSTTSEGYQRALKAAESFDNVHIVDSEHLTTGMGIFVVQLAMMVQKHYMLDEILEAIPSIKKRIRTSFLLSDPVYLYRAGRINAFVERICKMFSIYPRLELKKGYMKPTKVYGGLLEKAQKKYIKELLKNKKNIDKEIVFLTYSGCGLELRNLVRHEVEQYVQFDRVIEMDVSSAISSNCGPNTIGVMFLRK